MLILTRHQNQCLTIGDDIEVCLRSIEGQEVEIDVIAPKEATIYPEERYEKNSTNEVSKKKNDKGEIIEE